MQESFGNEVHIIVDKKPTNSFIYSFCVNLGLTKLIYNHKPLSYNKHQNIFMYGETVNYEKIINFQQIIISILENNKYDYIVVNSQEAFAAITTIDTQSKVILYTHLYKQIYPDSKIHDVFLPAYHRFYSQFLHFNHVIVGTQSERNKNKLLEQNIKNVEVLPMPMSETELLTKSNQHKEGVLFIGRWEVGKNPEQYIKTMKELQLPCKVMTNKNGEKKFIKAFNENNITNYEIKTGITGKDKVDFIKSCKVSFNCSLIENYPFSFLECVGHMPVVVLDTQDWSDNFEFVHKVNSKDSVSKIKELYNQSYSDDGLKYVNKLQENSLDIWRKL
jgi:glycosyltransferase involved in cell wall biosynthesis